MENLTLLIPAKFESESLPSVLEELKKFNYKQCVILKETDFKTINSIKNFNVEIINQQGSGYGNALIEGINNVQTEYLCIFNADGSFHPKYLIEMLDISSNSADFVFSSRYLKGAGTEDDTIITSFGNFFFSLLGRILFSLKLSDILYTYILGKTKSFKSLNLKCNDFCLCVEIPINAKKIGASYSDFPSFERKRIAGKKKVNEFRDGFNILISMIKLFFK